MNLWGGDHKTAAVFLWVSLLFILSGLLLYLIFSAPPDPPPHSHPVLAVTPAAPRKANLEAVPMVAEE